MVYIVQLGMLVLVPGLPMLEEMEGGIYEHWIKSKMISFFFSKCA